MSLLKALSAHVLIGNERRELELPAISGSLGELLKDLKDSSTTPETKILRAAGAIALYTQAGFEPRHNSANRPVECEDEKLAYVTDKNLLAIIPQLIQDGPRIVLRNLLAAVTHRQEILPAKMLPALLNLGKTYPLLAEDILKVCGARGVWLAQFNPDWSYLIDHNKVLDKDLWENGQQEQRLLFIKNFRAQDADAARELIAVSLSELDARDRASLLSVLAVNIHSADEAFIEMQLIDRSKELRNTASSLLCEIPSSAYVLRMQTRLTTLLSQERKLFRSHWQLAAPENFVADWSADAIEEKRPQHETLGEKAWWLFQLARSVTLRWWEKTTEMSPQDLIAWALKSDWSLALLRAWHHATLCEKNSAWSEAFLKEMPFKEFNIDGLELFEFLKPAMQEHYWLALLNSEAAKNRRGEFVGRIAKSVEKLSDKMSLAIINNVKKHLLDDSTKWDYPLRQSILDLACVIPVNCFKEATQGWPTDNPKAQFFTETLARLHMIIEQRKIIESYVELKS